MRDDLVQQLADVLAGERWPDLDEMSAQNRAALIEAQKPAARAVLASGLVVPTSDVLDLAQRYAAPDPHGPGTCDECDMVAELRALTQQEPR